MLDKNFITQFKKPSTSPTVVGEKSTTGLSPYLKFGCLSTRLMYRELIGVYESVKGKHSKPP